MKKRFVFCSLLILLFLVSYAYSHEREEKYDLDNSGLYPLSQLSAVMYGSIILGLFIAAILLFHKKMSDLAKKIAYFFVAAAVSLVTLYLVFTIVYINIISETNGPVHWHADFKIWVCDKEIKLFHPKRMSNEQGTNLIHSHDDNMIHIEGILLDRKQASLGAFFYAVQGSMSSDGLSVPTDDGLVNVHDGDKCNGQPAKLYVFVNGNLTANPSEYVISPYENVPPGDRIKIVFTEKSLEEIDPYLKTDNEKNEPMIMDTHPS